MKNATNAATKPIVTYETPVGCFSDWSIAADAVERCDYDACEVIKIVITQTPQQGVV